MYESSRIDVREETEKRNINCYSNLSIFNRSGNAPLCSFLGLSVSNHMKDFTIFYQITTTIHQHTHFLPPRPKSFLLSTRPIQPINSFRSTAPRNSIPFRLNVLINLTPPRLFFSPPNLHSVPIKAILQNATASSSAVPPHNFSIWDYSRCLLPRRRPTASSTVSRSTKSLCRFARSQLANSEETTETETSSGNRWRD